MFQGRGVRIWLSGGVAVTLALGLQVGFWPTSAQAATTFTVGTTSDIAANAGACGNTSIKTAPDPVSLREATCLANNNGGTSTINIPAGVYSLTHGELEVGTHSGQDVMLSGAGAGSTTITAGGASRVLDFDQNLLGGVTGTVSGLTITGGADSTFGGAGIIGGSLDATTADSLTVENSVITGNHANGTTPNTTNSPGGGVQFIGGALTISDSTISNNSSASSPGAGVAYEARGKVSGENLTISNTTFSGNSATNTSGSTVTNGGALDVRAPATTPMQVSDSQFVNNTVVATGSAGAVGAGIREESGALTVLRSTFTGNSVSNETNPTAPSGGAIYVTTGTATLHYNRFAGNTAAFGSAMLVGTGAGAVNATDNWFGCNGAPGSTGCDSVVSGAQTAPTLTPRLQLLGSATPSTVKGPNGTSTVSVSLTTDTNGASVAASNLTAFDGLPVYWTNPLPSGATVANSSTTMSSGVASVGYNSKNTSGSGSVIGRLDNGSVTVPIAVELAPTVDGNGNPSDETVNAGETASFTASASGVPTPTVQWQRSTNGGSSFSDLTGETSTTLSFTAALGDDGNQYRAVFTNDAGTATTTAATLSVNQPPAFTNDSTATFAVGSAGNFAITTSGKPPVSTIDESGALPSGLTFTDNGDGTANIIGTPGPGTAGTYPVTLTARNGISPDGSQSLTVQVNQAPSVTGEPSDQTVQPNTSVNFVAAADGIPAPTVQWQRSTNGGASFSDISGETSATLSFTAVAGDNGNQYRAVFTNAAGTATTDAATLHVGTAPAFTSGDATTFAVGSLGDFPIAVSGVPDATITATGTLPGWLTLTDNGDNTASLTGKPPAGSGGQYSFTLHASNGFSPAASQPFTLTVDESPTITSDDHTTFTAGSLGSFTVTTTPGVPSATTISKTGALPSGVTLVDNGNGTATLSGTPDAGTGGTYPITIMASATGGTADAAQQSFTLTVQGPPTITSTDHATFTVGTNGTFLVTTGPGVPAATTISKTGALPSGVSLVDNGDGTATLSGTPVADTGASYPITITASNGIAPDATQDFTLTVHQPPKINSADHATFTKSVSGSFLVTTSPGVPSATALSAPSADLPPGMTFVDNSDGTATLGGTPTADGVFTFTITASNGVTPDATQNFTATVEAAPQITSSDHTTFAVGQHGTFTVATTPGTPGATTLSETGSLPFGVTFGDNGDGTATLAGTPGVGTGGSYPITITAANSALDSTQSFTLTVTELPQITSGDATTFDVGSSGSFTVATIPGSPATTTITESGTLPSGVSFVDNGDGTATLSGTADAGTGGSYPITIRAANTAGHTDQAFTLTVHEAPAITSVDHTTFAVNQHGTYTVTTTAGTPSATTLSETGSLPSGVTFVDNGDGTATLAGTPAETTGGPYPITITAANSALNSTQSFTLTVTELPHITSADQTTFTVGNSGSFTVATGAGFPTPPTLSETGALPSGVTFTDSGDGTAKVAGTPDAGTGGAYPITIRAANTAGHTDQAFTLTVHEAPAITSADHTTFAVGGPNTFTVMTGAGFPTPVLAKTGALPSGVTFVDNGDGTATLSGSPDEGTGGTYPLAIDASNGVHPDASQSFTLTVHEGPAITSADHTTFTVASPGSFTVATGGGFPTPPALSETGALPAGVTFVDEADGTATLSGSPNAGTGGTYPLTITASNGVNPDAAQSFTLTVDEGPAITSADQATFTAGSPGSFTVRTTGGFPTPPALTKSGALPSGVTFVDNGDGTATLAGTPDAGTGGAYSLTITASNLVHPDATQDFTLNVNEAPRITSTDHTTFTVGSSGTFTVVSTGVPHASLTEAGTLPSGISFVDNGDGTATLAGRPDPGTNGSYPLTFTATNTIDHADQSFTLSVVKAAQTITITSTPPAHPVVGDSYTLTAVSDSGLTVSFSIDAATTQSACSISGADVSFDHSGACVIDADQGGDGTYQAAPQVQQSLAVSTIASSLSVTSSKSPTVFGQASHVTATVSADSGTPAGSVQFAVDGTDQGAPVTVAGGEATSSDLTGASGNPLAPGAHPVTATFTPDDTTTYAGATGSVTQIVDKAATTLALAVQKKTITAAVGVVAPGAGSPTGLVHFSVGGTPVGSATIVNGIATLHHKVKTGKTQHVAASYGGDSDFAGSSASTSRRDPSVVATVTSKHAKSQFGWYRSPVTIRFSCTTHGAPLTERCPTAVHLTHNGAGQSVTRTVRSTDGGASTVVVRNINIDQTSPTVRVTGVRNGKIYEGAAPTPRCVARDHLSGIATCTITEHTSGDRTTYQATAVDRAGNKSSVSGSYRRLAISIEGAPFMRGAFSVKLGHTYTVVVHSAKRPTYYDAAPVPTTPFVRDQPFRKAGHHRWALGVTMTHSLRSHKYWNIGAKIGSVMHVLRIRVTS